LFISSIEASANPLQNLRKEFGHEGTFFYHFDDFGPMEWF